MSDANTAHVPFTVPQGAPSAADGDYVVKDVDVLFRADTYPFPEEAGGEFVMTPADIRAALAAFPPAGVPLRDEHNPRSVFYSVGLGYFTDPRPTQDFARFGGKLRVKKPVLALLPPGPIRLSANWCRRSKTLKDVSLTETPRIAAAAAFSAGEGQRMSARAEQLLALTGAGRAVLRDRRADAPMSERHRYLLSLTGGGQALLRDRARQK